MEDWLSLTLITPPAAGEAAGAVLFEAGAYGIWEDLPDSEGRLVFRAGFPVGHESRLMSEIPAALVRLAETLELPLTSMALSLELKPGEDFSETWKKDLKPFPVGPKLWIVPSWWTEPLKPGPKTKILRLDPGPAFGSGLHPSTFLCLTLIYSLAEDNRSPARILDLGAGSGILAIAAALLFPQAEITGLDSDRNTLKVAQNNLKANQLQGRASFAGEPLSGQEPGFNLIAANLTLNTLTELSGEIKSKLAQDGLLIVSGLLTEQVPAMEETFKNLNLGVYSHLGQDEWSALLIGPDGPGSQREEVPRPESPA
ncbi:MAG: 50S ribosomal protein L11 methyltransferase [Deltaproteobacteria bacterium]|jgi:ribosomal protein L11 methyltransferase|nr:50S ribosomal protein L11 methyltransferase [Deltaproteobacteria bacterium]